MGTGSVKILYIAGAGRSGSTVLARLLGQQPGWFDGGEIFRFPENLIHEAICGCGAPFRSCPIWSQVLAQAFGGADRLDPQALSWRHQPVKNRHLLLSSRRRVDDRVRRTMTPYLEAIEAFYRSIAAVTGAAVIVDSSKSPLHGLFLELTGAVDLRVIQLVRDPRAVAYSTARRVKPGQRNQSFFASLHTWVRWNHLSSSLWSGGGRVPYMLLRYEDFVRRPRETLAAITALVGEEAGWDRFVTGDRDLHLEPTHHVSGNVGKRASGEIKLSLDEEWRVRMGRMDRVVAAACCAPWLLRYGYGGGVADR
jgi:hypothetical protein